MPSGTVVVSRVERWFGNVQKCFAFIYEYSLNHHFVLFHEKWKIPKTIFDVLLTVHLSVFISVSNQLDAQNFVSQ